MDTSNKLGNYMISNLYLQAEIPIGLNDYSHAAGAMIINL